MYANHGLMFELAKAKQYDRLVQAEKHNRARQVGKPAPASQPTTSRTSRTSRRAWQLVLRPQTQS
jgi:hypothetical protein